jgi:signal peptide peptidase SppA
VTPIGTGTHLIRFLGEKIISIMVPIVGLVYAVSMFRLVNDDVISNVKKSLNSADQYYLEVERMDDKFEDFNKEFKKFDPLQKRSPARVPKKRMIEILKARLYLQYKDSVNFLALEKLEEKYLLDRSLLCQKRNALIFSIRQSSAIQSVKEVGNQDFETAVDLEPNNVIEVVKKAYNDLLSRVPSSPTPDQLDEITKAELDLEKNFFASILTEFHGKISPKDQQMVMRHIASSRDVQPLFTLPDSRRHVFLITFRGDVMASQVLNLREEVTAVLTQADPERGDCVVVRLSSPGGTVYGYGLAAAQLARLKKVGINVVICVDEIAASGGYMMAVVSNKIYASPFAALGSIGVVSQAPNIQKRLEREGIEVHEITAGQYKRTLTPFKKPTVRDRMKVEQDINAVHELFKQHIQQHRPVVNLQQCATGEVWYGQDALKRKLCDELLTSDEVLLKMHDDGADIYSVKYCKRQKSDSLLMKLFSSSIANLALQLTSSGKLGITSDSFENSPNFPKELLSTENEKVLAYYRGSSSPGF